jgi:excisionase family DNA binding protein
LEHYCQSSDKLIILRFFGGSDSVVILAQDWRRTHPFKFATKPKRNYFSLDWVSSGQLIREISQNGGDMGFLKSSDIRKLLNMSNTKILDMAKNGEIPAYRFGREFRFKKEEIDVWLEERRCAPQSSEVSKDESIRNTPVSEKSESEAPGA